MQQIKTLCFSLLATVMLVAATSFTNTTFAQSKELPKLSLKELQDMPLKKLINPTELGEVTSCNISFDNEKKDIVELKVVDAKEPETLRQHVAKLKPGQMIYIDRRMAIVDGKNIKLPSIVYELVD